MAKQAANYLCENCGKEYLNWQGQCENCGQWGTIVEQEVGEKVTQVILKRAGGKTGKLNKPETLSEISKHKLSRKSTQLSEFDRVLGEGLMPGSVILLTGEPGVGKSTLLLQFALAMAKTGGRVLYISAEEGLEQIANRAERIQAHKSINLATGSKQLRDLELINLYTLEEISQTIAAKNSPDLIILDSIQTIASSQVRGIPGGMSQVKYCAAELTSLAKQLGKTLLIVGHINKEGSIAGPKLLEHLVDVVLQFTGEEKSSLKVLRAHKNRFGSIDEAGIFLMTETGLDPLANVGEYFLSDNNFSQQVGACRSIILEGVRPLVIEIQALAVPSEFAYPKRVAEGISLARLQVLAAVLTKHLRLKLHDYDIYVNVAQGFKVLDRGADLAVALAVISSVTNKPINNSTIAFGEISLAGKLTSAMYNSRRTKEAKRLGYKQLITPEGYDSLNQLQQVI